MASTILGSPDFARTIQERHLNSGKGDRELPAFRKLTGRPSLDEIVTGVGHFFQVNDRQATKTAICLCHRCSGAKLKEIGERFGLTESGVTRASKRFEAVMEGDEKLKDVVLEIRRSLKVSIA